MAIKAQCGSCGTRVNAKDSLAGKRVKCPKCGQALAIPGKPTAPRTAVAKSAKSPATSTRPVAASGANPAGYNPLLDLLDEAGVKAPAQGPVCENCGADLHPSAMVCVQCGYNMATGKMLETAVFDDDDDHHRIVDTGITDTDRILAKAEKDIEDMPVTAVGQNFGDGADSMIIAAVALVVFSLIIGAGLAAVFLMDQLSNLVSSARISLYASIGVYLICMTWIASVAFIANVKHGIACLATGGLYCIIFGFLQGKSLLLPTLIMIGSLVIGGACFAYVNATGASLMHVLGVG